MKAQSLTVDVHVRPFFDGEQLTADRLNELVSQVNAVNAGASMPALVLGVASAAVQSRRKVSRRALLGLR